MSKSLGERLFAACLGVSGESDLWGGIGAREQSRYERSALAFCASLSHEESAMEAIAALKDERDSLLAALRSIHDAQAFGADAAALDDLIRDIRQAARAALTTKEG